MAEIAIRRLEPRDAAAFIALRRQGLAEEPMAFAASLEDDVTNQPAAVEAGLAPDSDLATFGAFDGDALVGCVTLGRQRMTKLRHKAGVFGVFVAPPARRRGAARRMLEAAIAHARATGVGVVFLTVSETTPAARALYEQLGFVCWGTESDALCFEGRTAAEHHMRLRL